MQDDMRYPAFFIFKNKMKICAIFLLTNPHACGIMGRPRMGAATRIPAYPPIIPYF